MKTVNVQGVPAVIKLHKFRSSLRLQGSQEERLECAIKLVESMADAPKYSYIAFPR